MNLALAQDPWVVFCDRVLNLPDAEMLRGTAFIYFEGGAVLVYRDRTSFACALWVGEKRPPLCGVYHLFENATPLSAIQRMQRELTHPPCTLRSRYPQALQKARVRLAHLAKKELRL